MATTPALAETKAHARECIRKLGEIWEESKAIDNSIAKERAVIEELKYTSSKMIRERSSRNEIDPQEYTNLVNRHNDAIACFDAENKMKRTQAYHRQKLREKQSGCSQDEISVRQLEIDTAEKARVCAQVDQKTMMEYLRRFSELKLAKLSNPELPSPALKRADTSQTNSEFCSRLREAVTAAPSFFKAIKGEKITKYFVEPGLLGSAGVKISDMLKTDSFETSVQLNHESMAQKADCEIEIGWDSNLFVRRIPEYACKWNYENVTRKQLEAKTDHLLNVARGCFPQTSELDSESREFERHRFVVQDSVAIAGSLHYGEGKESEITLSVSKYTPKEDEACFVYSTGKKKASDRELCLQRYPD